MRRPRRGRPGPRGSGRPCGRSVASGRARWPRAAAPRTARSACPRCAGRSRGSVRRCRRGRRAPGSGRCRWPAAGTARPNRPGGPARCASGRGPGRPAGHRRAASARPRRSRRGTRHPEGAGPPRSRRRRRSHSGPWHAHCRRTPPRHVRCAAPDRRPVCSTPPLRSTSWKVPSALWNRTGIRKRPRAIRRQATPRLSRTSRVRGCRPLPREPLKGAVALSTTRTLTPRRASSQAAVRPVGPAPTTSTSQSGAGAVVLSMVALRGSGRCGAVEGTRRRAHRRGRHVSLPLCRQP